MAPAGVLSCVYLFLTVTSVRVLPDRVSPPTTTTVLTVSIYRSLDLILGHEIYSDHVIHFVDRVKNG